MKKVFIHLLLLSSIFAKLTNLNAVYKITYGFFGKMGEANTSIKIDKYNNYTIKIKAYATGFAKDISGGLKEYYISKGKIINNKFRPLIFTKETIKQNKKKYYTYVFDYKKKQILKKYTKKSKVYDSIINLNNLSNINKRKFHWKTTNTQKILNFWTNEDILSLFFNIKDLIKHFKKNEIQHLVAVGAGEARKGQIDIIIPNTVEYKNIKKILGKDNTNNQILKVIIYNNLFTSKSGELYISLDKQGLCDKALLKDVFLFGDITGTLYK